MKKIRRTLILACIYCMFHAVTAAFADTALPPVPVSWLDIRLTSDGYMGWSYDVPLEYRTLVPKQYEAELDLMTNGTWRTAYKTYKTSDTGRDITYSQVGLYRFRVRIVFIGGQVSEWSPYSETCTVTRDDVAHEDQPGGYVPEGPGVPAGQQGFVPGGPGGNLPVPGNVQAIGSGSLSYTPRQIPVITTIPPWVEKNGSWQLDSYGNWTYHNAGRLYANTWACIYNPYADPTRGQRQYDWFCFNESGIMRTGWFSDGTGTYFLNPASDGTRGRMLTGWAVIDGFYYYFSEAEGSGTMGAMYRSRMTPDGHMTDAQGRMIS